MTALAPVPADRLPALSDRANAEHAAYEVTQRAALAHAIACGEALIEAKAQLRHGEWLPWVRDHLDFGQRTARYYMQIARNRQRVADVGSVREALARLAEPRLPHTDLWTRWKDAVGDKPFEPLSARTIRKRYEDWSCGKYEPIPRDPQILRHELAVCQAREARLRQLLRESESHPDKKVTPADQSRGDWMARVGSDRV